MESNGLNRRDFTRLTAAAFGGMLSGTLAGCGSGGKAAAADLHICRGLNACKNLGASKSNACAGQGDCATAKAHSCHGLNECKGQGACGAAPGQNACKGQGGCGVPTKDKMWENARKHFEEVMKKADKKFGDAPAAKEM